MDDWPSQDLPAVICLNELTIHALDQEYCYFTDAYATNGSCCVQNPLGLFSLSSFRRWLFIGLPSLPNPGPFTHHDRRLAP